MIMLDAVIRHGTEACLLAGLAYEGYRHIKRSLAGEDLQTLPSINAQFRQLVVEGPSEELSFNGSEAEIVDDTPEYFYRGELGPKTLLRIQRYARNRHGEYFFFISDGTNKPLFKHVPHTVAKVALKEKYIAHE